MKTINQNEFVGLLLGIRGATFATLHTITDAHANKTGPADPVTPDPRLPAHYSDIPYDTRVRNPFPLPIKKEAVVNAVLNFHYDAGVLRRLEKEGKDASVFRRGESWHRPVIDADGNLTPLCMHKEKHDKLYVWYQPRVVSGNVLYRDAENHLLNYSAIKKFLPNRNGEGSNQGLDDPMKYRIVELSNIRRIVLDGGEYLVKE